MELYHKRFIQYDYMTCRPLVSEILQKATSCVSRKKNILDVCAAFDIETTRTKNLLKDPTSATKCGTFFSYCYCWQCHIEDVFIFGRDPAEFFALLNFISEELEKKRGRKKNPYILLMYVHNLAYEYNCLFNFFSNASDVLYINNDKPLYITLQNVEFRCSYLLTHKPLKELGEEVGIPKGEDFAYDTQRNRNDALTDEEMEYCFRDTYILMKWLHLERERLGNVKYQRNLQSVTEYVKKMEAKNCKLPPKQKEEYEKAKKMLKEMKAAPLSLAHIPLTQTGYVRQDIKEVFSDTRYGRICREYWQLTDDEYTFLRHVFRGGDTYGNQRHIGETFENVKHRDFCSAYPAFMLTDEFPCGKFTHEDNPTNERVLSLMKYKACCMKMTFYNIMLKEDKTPYIPSSKSEGEDIELVNNRVTYATELTTCINEDDYAIICDVYDFDSFSVSNFMWCNMAPLPSSIKKLLFQYFNDKTVYKGKKDERSKMLYQIAKQKLNSIFGCAAMRLDRDTYELAEDGFTQTAGGKFEGWKVMPYQWAPWITSHVRRHLNEFKTAMNDNFLYGDTDSIFYIETPEVEELIEKRNEERIEQLREVGKSLELQESFIFPESSEGPQVLGAFVCDKGEEYCQR